MFLQSDKPPTIPRGAGTDAEPETDGSATQTLLLLLFQEGFNVLCRFFLDKLMRVSSSFFVSL